MRTKRDDAAAVAVQLTPAMTFRLMTGQFPTVRLHGWVTLAHAGMYGEPTPDVVWDQHRDVLIDEAAAHDFVPFWLHKHRPSGEAFSRWQWQFLQRHQY